MSLSKRQFEEELGKSGISEATAKMASVCPFEGNKEDLKGLIGFAKKDGLHLLQAHDFIKFPYFNRNSEVLFHRLKLIPAGEYKYIQPHGQPTIPYILPSVWKVAESPKSPIWITEGEKKALKLIQHGRDAIALPGVWQFSNGEAHPDKRNLCQDLLDWNWRERTVYLGFDMDLWINPQVRYALWELAFRLYEKGAEIRFVSWHRDIGKGIDDFLVYYEFKKVRAEEKLTSLEYHAKPIEEFVSVDHEKAILRALSLVSDSMTEYHREKTIKAISKSFGISIAAIKKEIGRRHGKAVERAEIDWDDSNLVPEIISDLPKNKDVGNGRLLCFLFGQNLKYCHPWSKWLIWSGKHWQRDDRGQIVAMGKDTIDEIFRSVAKLKDDDKRKGLAQHAIASQGANKIKALIEMAQSEPEIPILPDEMDKDPWLLNTITGTVDLKAGQLHPHERKNLITKMSRIDFDPEARCPLWLNFLDRIMDGDLEMIEFLKRAVGYSLTADVSAQCLFFLYGTGRNGKSTFLNTILEIMGDYAREAAPDVFINRHGETHPTELADFMGARMVCTTEIEDGKQLAEALVKKLTGGERIKARFMRQDFFEFKPTHKIWMAANHQPIIRGTDFAIWRRIKKIPFEVTISDEEKDEQLTNKLKSELSGILAWAVEGCLEWQRDGLKFPKKIDDATESYRIEMDVLGSFLEEKCLLNPILSVTKASFYKTYTEWCDKNGERPWKERVIAQKMKERGFEKNERTTTARYWSGLGLLIENGGYDRTSVIMTEEF